MLSLAEGDMTDGQFLIRSTGQDMRYSLGLTVHYLVVPGCPSE